MNKDFYELTFEKDGKKYTAYKGIVECTKDNKIVWQVHGHIKDGAVWTKKEFAVEEL